MSVMRSRRTRAAPVGALGDGRSDAALAAAAAVGDRAAFELLYRRHSAAAWGVASAVAASPEDAADAVSDAFTRVLTALEAGRLQDESRFRSYLLSATRNAAVDLHRRSGRSRPTDRLDQLDRPTPARTATERVDDRQDARFVADAFRGLPERWRSVLWLTEVEGIPPREAADLLGLSPNSVSQLALRARAGLRERFVQAHLREDVAEDCRFCVERLGGYVVGTLAPRELARVDQHLAGCQGCRDRAAELDDLRTSLRRVILPLPLLLGPVLARWDTLRLVTPTPSVAAPAAGDVAASARSGLGFSATKPLLAVSTGLFALGVIGATVVDGRRGLGRALVPPPPVEQAGAAAPPSQVVAERAAATSRIADAVPLASAIAASFDDDDGDADAVRASAEAAITGGAPGGTLTPPEGGGGGDADPPPAAKPAPATPLVNVAVTAQVLGQPAAVSLGSGDGSCSEVAAGPSPSRCGAEPASGSVAAVAVATEGTVAGGLLADRSITLGL